MRRQQSKGNVMDESISLMNKKVEDLTVGDSLKISFVTLTVMVAVPVTIGMGFAAKEKFDVWNMNRKTKKFEQTENES